MISYFLLYLTIDIARTMVNGVHIKAGFRGVASGIVEMIATIRK